jgi:mono/diheme cytochrome c family protein
MAANSSGFTIAAGMGIIVLLMGYTLLSAAGLAGFAGEEIANQPLVCGVMATDTLDSPVQEKAGVPVDEPMYVAGQTVFVDNCAQCHSIYEVVVGPALMGITTRHSRPWLTAWIQNSSKVVASGDAYAVKLFNEYGKQQMPSFSLSDKEIEALLKYVEVEEQQGNVRSVAVVN